MPPKLLKKVKNNFTEKKKRTSKKNIADVVPSFTVENVYSRDLPSHLTLQFSEPSLHENTTTPSTPTSNLAPKLPPKKKSTKNAPIVPSPLLIDETSLLKTKKMKKKFLNRLEDNDVSGCPVPRILKQTRPEREIKKTLKRKAADENAAKPFDVFDLSPEEVTYLSENMIKIPYTSDEQNPEKYHCIKAVEKLVFRDSALKALLTKIAKVIELSFKVYKTDRLTFEICQMSHIKNMWDIDQLVTVGDIKKARSSNYNCFRNNALVVKQAIVTKPFVFNYQEDFKQVDDEDVVAFLDQMYPPVVDLTTDDSADDNIKSESPPEELLSTIKEEYTPEIDNTISTDDYNKEFPYMNIN